MKWISKINQVPQVALMSTNLADILRFCITPDEFVPLRRELEILSRYVEIQRIRLSESFSYTEAVPEALLFVHGSENAPAAAGRECHSARPFRCRTR